jgi:hypothetical protein
MTTIIGAGKDLRHVTEIVDPRQQIGVPASEYQANRSAAKFQLALGKQPERGQTDTAGNADGVFDVLGKSLTMRPSYMNALPDRAIE